MGHERGVLEDVTEMRARSLEAGRPADKGRAEDCSARRWASCSPSPKTIRPEGEPELHRAPGSPIGSGGADPTGQALLQRRRARSQHHHRELPFQTWWRKRSASSRPSSSNWRTPRRARCRKCPSTSGRERTLCAGSDHSSWRSSPWRWRHGASMPPVTKESCTSRAASPSTRIPRSPSPRPSASGARLSRSSAASTGIFHHLQGPVRQRRPGRLPHAEGDQDGQSEPYFTKQTASGKRVYIGRKDVIPEARRLHLRPDLYDDPPNRVLR